MAAWNERRLIRDVYDIWFYLKLGVKPDFDILNKRLNKCSYSKLVNKEDYFMGNGISDFYDFLRSYVSQLTDQLVIDSLQNYLNREDLAGIAMMIRTEFSKLT